MDMLLDGFYARPINLRLLPRNIISGLILIIFFNIFFIYIDAGFIRMIET